MQSILIVIIGSIISLLLLTGCETMEGFGKDVESAGEEIEESAEDHD